MPPPAVTERALILNVAASGESFLKLNVLTAEAGAFLCLKRISRKKPQQTAPDLFDTADIHLATSGQGTARFVNEYRLVHRRSQIGHSYRALQHASEFGALLALNGPHMVDPGALFQLAERTLDAFAERNAPGIVLLKGIYLLLKDEGYPVRESWWPEVPQPLRDTARRLLNQPTPGQVDPDQLDEVDVLTRNLCLWMRRETDLMLPDCLKT